MSIDLSSLTQAKKKGKAQPEKPCLPDPNGELIPLVSQCIENEKVIAAHTGTLTTAKATLAKAAFAHACQLYAGRDTKIDDTFQIGTASGKAIVCLQNRYKLPEDLASVRSILGEHAGEVLRSSFVIKVDSDAMPRFIQQAFVDGLVKLARDLDAMIGTDEGTDGPVFAAISVTPQNAVDKTFHERRYAMLNPAQNAELHRLMPCVIATRFDY